MNKQYIIKSNDEIKAIISKRKSVGSSFYAIYFKKSTDFKLCVTVSKKIGNAVERNYQKRVVKEIIRKQMDKIRNVNLIIVVKQNSISLSFVDKEKEITRLIKKIRGINNEK